MTEQNPTLIVPVDETELSERAVPVAGAMAAAVGGDVVLVTVDSPHVDPGPIEMYQASLHRLVPPGTAVHHVAVLDEEETVGGALIREAYERPGAVVVMATHARTGLGELVLGSTADAVVRSAPGPVVLVGPHSATAWSAGTTVVAVDGSPVTDRVLDAAAEWAAATGAPLAVLHVLSPVAVDGGSVVTGSPELAEAAAAQLREVGAPAVAATVESASPADAVVRWASDRGASLVIVGSERQGRVRRALLGSVAMAVVRHAGCPVMVVGDVPGSPSCS